MKLSHLLFADDLQLFLEADRNQAELVTEVLNKFCAWSGLKVSNAKTSLYFSPNMPEAAQQEMERLLGFKWVLDLGRYLGVPLIHDRVTKRTYETVLSKADKWLAGWKAITLLMARRVVLAQSVINSL